MFGFIIGLCTATAVQLLAPRLPAWRSFLAGALITVALIAVAFLARPAKAADGALGAPITDAGPTNVLNEHSDLAAPSLPANNSEREKVPA